MKEKTSKTILLITVSLSIIFGFIILGFIYNNIQLRKEKIEQDSAKKIQMTNTSVVPTQTRNINNETTELQRRQKECDQAYTYLKNKYNNIISVTYSTKLNDCMISVPDESGTPVWVKMSESTFN